MRSWSRLEMPFTSPSPSTTTSTTTSTSTAAPSASRWSPSGLSVDVDVVVDVVVDGVGVVLGRRVWASTRGEAGRPRLLRPDPQRGAQGDERLAVGAGLLVAGGGAGALVGVGAHEQGVVALLDPFEGDVEGEL